MRGLIAIALVAACGGGAKKPADQPRVEEDSPVPAVAAPPGTDARVVHLRTMTESLAVLAAEIERITGAEPASAARCEKLAEALLDWGGDHLESYEVADAEGAFLGITDADAENAALRELASQLARTSKQLVDPVDEACLHGEKGAYGAILFEYLIAYQGLEHWVADGDPARWEYEALAAG
jgi:hypothetical protein